jgi:hypothetical protein
MRAKGFQPLGNGECKRDRHDERRKSRDELLISYPVEVRAPWMKATKNYGIPFRIFLGRHCWERIISAYIFQKRALSGKEDTARHYQN